MSCESVLGKSLPVLLRLYWTTMVIQTRPTVNRNHPRGSLDAKFRLRNCCLYAGGPINSLSLDQELSHALGHRCRHDAHADSVIRYRPGVTDLARSCHFLGAKRLGIKLSYDPVSPPKPAALFIQLLPPSYDYLGFLLLDLLLDPAELNLPHILGHSNLCVVVHSTISNRTCIYSQDPHLRNYTKHQDERRPSEPRERRPGKCVPR